MFLFDIDAIFITLILSYMNRLSINSVISDTCEAVRVRITRRTAVERIAAKAPVAALAEGSFNDVWDNPFDAQYDSI